MAFIGIFLADALLVFIFGTAFLASIFLIISMVLLIKSKKVQKKGENIGKNIGAIITLTISIFLFLPLRISTIIFLVKSGVIDVEEKRFIESIENKVIVNQDEWKNGFEYDGKKLVPVNLLMNSDNYNSDGAFKNLNKIGALVIKYTNNYYSFYELDSNSGYKIYYVMVTSFTAGEYYSRTFVDENDYDEVLNYYETAELKISASWKSAPKESKLSNQIIALNLNIIDKQDELMKLSREVLDDVSKNKNSGTLQKDNDNHMEFKIRSIDRVFNIDLDIYTKDNEMEVYLNEYKVDEEIVEKYKEMLFDLINDSQAELLSGL